MTRRAVPPAAAGSGCEAFSQAAMLRVDRELGPAEGAALDAHLAVCPACRLKAAQAEALSAVLKRWDNAQAGSIQAPARLRMALRAAVADEGRWRRVETGRIRRLHLATAASVVLALGAGLLAGLWSVSLQAGAEPVFTASWVPGRAAVALADLPALESASVELGASAPPPSRLRDLKIEEGRPTGWLTADERALARQALARSQTQRLLREAFERDYGEDAYWLVDARGGEERLITRSAWLHLQSSPALRVIASRQPEEARTVADPVRMLDTGRTVADFLGLPGRRDALERALLEERRPIKQGADAPAFGHVSFLLPERGRAPRAVLRRTVDLAYAVAKGEVILREGAGDDLVAVVHGTRHPVFLPAGELIGGGRVDRVVLEGTLLPVTSSARPVLIPCVAASTVGGSHGDHPTPTGMVAGPSLRSLLARKTSVHEVRAWIAAHVPILDKWGRDYSLLAFYDSTAQTANLKVLTSLFLVTGARGFALTDLEDGLVGVEVSDLPRESASPLLARLLVGYSAELHMAAARARIHGEPPAARAEPRPSVMTLLDLVGSTERFRALETRSTDARVLRMVESRTDVGVEVVEETPGGGAVLVSGFAR
jgi:hypothetical protein